MRWSLLIGTVALLSASWAGFATAQSNQPVNKPLPVSTPGYVISPGCETPGRILPPIVVTPGTVMPGPIVVSPGNVMPGPIVTPGNVMPGNVMPGPSNVTRPPLSYPTLPQVIPSPSNGGLGQPVAPPIGTLPGANAGPSPSGSAPTPSLNAPPAAAATPAATANAPSSNAGTPSLAGAAPPAGSGSVESAAPNMIGDFGIGAAGQLKGVSRTLRVPLVSRGGIKISENESPRPQDRVFFNYNYFNNVTVFNTASGPQTVRPTFDLHRETFGFEKTFLSGDASVGMRLPILQKDGLGGVGADGFGDLTIVSKFAAINDLETGDVLSGGVVLTLPTGRSIFLANNEKLDAVLIQPWMGFIYNSDRLYLVGFTGVIISTDSRDVSFYTADLGVGYRAYTATDDSIIRSLTPTVEVHTNIPLNHGGINSSDVIVFPNQVILTGGVHIGVGDRSTFTLGVALPITGPNPYDFELLCQFNMRF